MHRCKYLAHGLFISYSSFLHCHISVHAPNERSKNYILPYNGPKDKVNWDKIFEIKQKLVKEMRYENKIPTFCQGCRWLEEFEDESDERYKSDLENYIDIVWLGHSNECNSRCIYCRSLKEIYSHQSKKDYGVIKLLEEILRKGLYNPEKVPDSYLSFAMGEPTMLKDFDKIIKLLYKYGNKNFAIYTNAIKFSKMVEKVLHNKDRNMTVIVSLDSGSRETYKRVKLVDKFNDVCKNLKKYVSAAEGRTKAVAVKYIIIPNVNDNMEELDKFYTLCTKELNVRYIMADIEEKWYVLNKGIVPEYIKEMLRHIRKRCEEDGIEFDFFESAFNLASRSAL